MTKYIYHNIAENTYKELSKDEAEKILFSEYPSAGAGDVIHPALENGGSIPVLKGYISLTK